MLGATNLYAEELVEPLGSDVERDLLFVPREIETNRGIWPCYQFASHFWSTKYDVNI
jgi:hypothetical protein